MLQGLAAGKPPSERMLIDESQRAIQSRLPHSWAVTTDIRRASADSGVDAIVTASAPDSSKVRFGVTVKSTLQPRDVDQLKRSLDSSRDRASWDTSLVAARYFSNSTRNRLVEAGLSYVDATGNAYVRSDLPALFIANQGLESDPWRRPGRPRGTLKGAPAAQVVRALIDGPGPWRVRELITAADTSTGSVYRVVDFLESEALLTRSSDTTLSVSSWPALLRRWSEDYEFLATNAVTSWIAPRGIESVLGVARETDSSNYALTGTVAAATWSPYAPVRSVMTYAENPSDLAEAWGLRQTDAGANVFIAEPAYSALTRGATLREDGLSIAAPAQVAADLLTGPGRAPSEAEELISWMEANESEWR